jgi:hypothetical protein
MRSVRGARLFDSEYCAGESRSTGVLTGVGLAVIFLPDCAVNDENESKISTAASKGPRITKKGPPEN